MKIGLFTDTYYPQISGVATSISTLKKHLEAVGHEVYIFTTTDPKMNFGEKNVYRIPSLPFVSERRIGVCLNHFKRLIMQLELDIIHTHTEFSLGRYGRRLAKELDIPLIHTMHTIYEEYTHYVIPLSKLDSIAKSTVKRLVTNFCNSADEVIVPTGKTKQLLTSYGVMQQISIIPTGINLEKFSPKGYKQEELLAISAKLGIRQTDKVLLYIGRISEEKNIQEIFYHIKEYVKQKKGIKFLLIGDGPERKTLEETAKLLRIEQNVIFAGQRPWTDIGKYYQLGDVFVTASQSETQGLTYIEALAAGLPLLAKADPCLDDVVQNGINGYTFTEKTDFLKSLEKLIDHELFRKRMSIAAMQSVKNYSSKCFADSVEGLYWNAIEKKYRTKAKVRTLI